MPWIVLETQIIHLEMMSNLLNMFNWTMYDVVYRGIGQCKKYPTMSIQAAISITTDSHTYSVIVKCDAIIKLKLFTFQLQLQLCSYITCTPSRVYRIFCVLAPSSSPLHRAETRERSIQKTAQGVLSVCLISVHRLVHSDRDWRRKPARNRKVKRVSGQWIWSDTGTSHPKGVKFRLEVPSRASL